MRASARFLLLGLSMVGFSVAEDKTTSSAACTATSASGSFYDLRPDTAVKPPASDSRRSTSSRQHPTTDYHARGYDYGANFTLNICGSVVGEIDNVRGIDKGAWANISAYYTSKGDVYSLGSQSASLTSRGRKLVLQYKGGSPCGSKNEKRSLSHEGSSYRTYEDEDERAPQNKTTSASGGPVDSMAKESETRRKSATISFLCDRDSMSGTAASFVGVDPDECAYFFEVRSQHACAGAEPHKPGSVGPGSVFAIILLIAILVYLGGGIFYNRTVANARGWRQLPNYAMWASLWNLISDFFVIITSSCARFMPSRRGYHYVSGSPTRRGRDREAENRLIDNLDEEWED